MEGRLEEDLGRQLRRGLDLLERSKLAICDRSKAHFEVTLLRLWKVLRIMKMQFALGTASENFTCGCFEWYNLSHASMIMCCHNISVEATNKAKKSFELFWTHNNNVLLTAQPSKIEFLREKSRKVEFLPVKKRDVSRRFGWVRTRFYEDGPAITVVITSWPVFSGSKMLDRRFAWVERHGAQATLG